MKDLMEEKILLYASDRFFRRDLRFTMESVAKDLSISKKTLYKYFKNKDDLLDGVVGSFKKEITDKFESTFNDRKDTFVAMCEVFTFLAFKLGLKIDHHLLTDIKKIYPRIWEDIYIFRSKQINKYFPKIIKSGIQNGYIRKDVNIQLAFSIFFSSINNIITPEFLMESSIPPGAAIKEILTIFFYGITTTKGKKKFNKHFKNIFEVTNEK